MNILLSNIIEFNVAINIYCNVVPSQLLGMEWKADGGGGGWQGPQVSILQKGGPGGSWSLAGFKSEEGRGHK